MNLDELIFHRYVKRALSAQLKPETFEYPWVGMKDGQQCTSFIGMYRLSENISF